MEWPMPDTNMMKNLDELYEMLGSEQHHMHFQPEYWKQQEKNHGSGIYAEILYMLTRIKFEHDEAQHHWFNILGHRLYLQSRLERDVGMQVALADYFINVTPMVERPIIIEINLYTQKEQIALRDELTGLFNRRFFNSIMEKQQAMSDRFEQPFSLIMVDVDKFKNYNDRFGHLAGDRALAQIARVLSMTSRSLDYLVRYGGEEFAIILPGINKDQAAVAAERHRVAVEECKFFQNDKLPAANLTISLGAATYPEDAKSIQELVYSADVALYTAKSGGRNRVETAQPDRRRYPRIPYVAAVDLLSQSSHTPIQGESRDVSRGGICLAVDQPLEQGQPLAILVHSPELEQALKLAGLSVRLSVEERDQYKYQVAVDFSAHSGNGTKTWQNLIDQLLNDSSSPAPLPMANAQTG